MSTCPLFIPTNRLAASNAKMYLFLLPAVLPVLLLASHGHNLPYHSYSQTIGLARSHVA